MKLLPLPLLACVLVLAACGGSSGGNPDADPAAVVPARAPLYFEANLAPEGELADDVKALSRKLAGTDDPGGEIVRLIERSARRDRPGFSWKKDVDPWLGDRGGIFVLDLAGAATGGKVDAAAVVATADADKAQEFLDEELRRPERGEPAPRVVDRKHRDASYKLEQRTGTAVAIVSDYAVVGREAAVKAVIDAAEGKGLADTDRFKQARDQVADDGLGFAYVGVSSLLSGLGPQGAALRPVLGWLGETAAMSLDVDANAVRVDSASLGVERGGPAGAGPGSVFGALPRDAWLALGVSDLGGTFSRALAQFGQLGALGGVDVEQEIRRSLGIDVQRDLLSWMGDAGIFVSGSSLGTLGGGLVVEATDVRRARAAVPRLARLAARLGEFSVSELRGGSGVRLRSPRVPVPIEMGVTDDGKFVLAAGGGAFEAASSGSGTLSESPAFRAARGALGEGMEPQFFVDLAPVRTLLGSFGLAERGEGGKRAQQALDALTTIVAGTKRDGSIARGRLVVGVK